MKILVCGDRNWGDRALIEEWLVGLVTAARERDAGEPILIMHGGARGADYWAGVIARDHGWACVPYPADWRRYGRAAGPMRNRRMLLIGKPDLVLAFHDDLAASKGTKDMIEAANEAGVKVRVVSHQT